MNKQDKMKDVVAGAAAAPPAFSLESAPASSFKMKSIRWVWPNRFARGKIGLIVGLPDLAKSLILTFITACITTGGPWPCGEGRAPRGRVLLLTAEDDIEDTVIPRLVAAGASLELVEIVQMVRDKSSRRMFNVASDLAILRQKLEQFDDVVMVVIDPLSAYLGVGKVDSYRTTDVRGVLGPVKMLAEEKRISVLGLLHFNKKVDVTNAMLRISDSLAFTAAARHCFAAIDDPENKCRLLVKVKNNIAPDIKALSYTLEAITVGKDDQTGDTIAAPRIVWGSEHVEITATEALEAEANANKQARQGGAQEKARNLLGEILASGPVPMTTVEAAARKNDISLRTLKRAKRDLHVDSKWDRKQKHWIWLLHDPQQGDGQEQEEIPF
jgi:putative DNA primase/helicase